ncbi:uncharacterized protein LOC119176365 isoform X1 [Rhipicephalus microplus]|uniref:uncharacterized protein LOC119176365 isoform X1 n=2 Tax=Rhipicephalus microplus TaxID=6941 RepID=UPI003F6CFB20
MKAQGIRFSPIEISTRTRELPQPPFSDSPRGKVGVEDESAPPPRRDDLATRAHCAISLVMLKTRLFPEVAIVIAATCMPAQENVASVLVIITTGANLQGLKTLLCKEQPQAATKLPKTTIYTGLAYLFIGRPSRKKPCPPPCRRHATWPYPSKGCRPLPQVIAISYSGA